MNTELLSLNRSLQRLIGQYDATCYFVSESERAKSYQEYLLKAIHEIQNEIKEHGIEIDPEDLRPMPDWVYYGFQREEDYVEGEGCGVVGCCI